MQTNKSFMGQLNHELTAETGIVNLYNKYCGKLTLEELFTTDNVYIAAYHCACGFRYKPDTFAFMSSAWRSSWELAQSVLNGTFRPSYCREQIITERGKPRTIRPPRFTCKIVQKVLCDCVLRPLLEPKMISTVYSSIRGKGLDQCFNAILRALNKRRDTGGIIVQADYSNYFASIDHDILRYSIGRYIADPRVTDLFMLFCDGDTGLSLGNEASQVPASYFPSPVDHELKDRLGCRDYYRYMDDSIIIADNEDQAGIYAEAVKRKSAELKLTLKPEKIRRIPYGRSFTFCKERFLFNKHDHIYYRIQNPAVPRTEKRKIRRFGELAGVGGMSRERAGLQVRSVMNGMKKHPNNFRKACEIEKLAEMYGIKI